MGEEERRRAGDRGVDEARRESDGERKTHPLRSDEGSRQQERHHRDHRRGIRHDLGAQLVRRVKPQVLPLDLGWLRRRHNPYRSLVALCPYQLVRTLQRRGRRRAETAL